jgi:GNAT superfamily N-acetyltransferase
VNTPIIRPARISDYEAFARLFPELGVDDPVPAASRWEAEMATNTLVAERGGAVVGYAFFQLLHGAGYIRHVVVSPAARRGGIGVQLMAAVAAKMRAFGARQWHLNVKPDNVAAIRLYESLGMRRQYESSALRLPWRCLDRLPNPSIAVRAAPISSAEEAQVEVAMKLVSGQLADARGREGRLLMQLRDGSGRVAGVAIFDPGFPGAFPFRVAAPALAGALLRELCVHARPEHDFIQIVTEDDRPLRDLLVSVGATVHLDFLHFEGALE